jgi:beta-1,4-mannosyl-glycoprotein beta-1,4-N-acetylglucosaminyltransferase|tara:strand:+ start:464 stop:1279 length:816 start_codon:yes stop_codon:yes gene_type:complete
MKLIDCFMYFDEDLVLEIRLNTLYKFVDKFVIAEATKNHAGQDKKLNFKIKKFSKFKDKIEYLVVDDLPINVEANKKGWHESHVRDQFQRNALAKGYENCNQNDLIMISDIDEIPNPDKIKDFNIKDKYGCFLQKNFQSKINLLNITENYWPGTKICQKKYLKSPQWLRNIKTKKRSFWNFFRDKQPQLIESGGWHFSFLKDSQSIKKKIISYSHQEYNKDEFIDIQNIENKILNHKDLFNRNIKYKVINVDDSFPKYIVKNKEKFKDWII